MLNLTGPRPFTKMYLTTLLAEYVVRLLSFQDLHKDRGFLSSLDQHYTKNTM